MTICKTASVESVIPSKNQSYKISNLIILRSRALHFSVYIIKFMLFVNDSDVFDSERFKTISCEASTSVAYRRSTGVSRVIELIRSEIASRWGRFSGRETDFNRLLVLGSYIFLQNYFCDFSFKNNVVYYKKISCINIYRCQFVTNQVTLDNILLYSHNS